ncbi:MAG: YesL family protein [Firmicutes bacterium]|nr:YesL family protein [Bacillota bacterium]
MKLFDPEGIAFSLLTDTFDLVFANVLFLICCLPVITIGPAISALYKVCRNIQEDRGSGVARTFFSAFKDNLKEGIIAWLIIAGLLLLCGVDFWYWFHYSTGTTQQIMLVLCGGIVALILMCAQWIFPIQYQFRNTVKNTLKNSLLFALKYLIPTLLMSVLTAGWLFLLLYFDYLRILFLIIGISLPVFLKTYYIRKIFKQYLPAEENTPEE